MPSLQDFETALRKRFPEDPLMSAEVPVEERSVREREEHVHFKASQVAWMESVGDRQVQLHLMSGRAVVLRGELWRALKWFQHLGYPFVRTHRQVIVRMDRVTGAEQA